MDEPEIDLARLQARWAELWPDVPFLDVDTTSAPDREIRMHSLPKSKRYPDEAQEWAQLLHRQLTLLGELVDSTPAQRERLLLVTRAYSAEPTWDPSGRWVEQRGEWFDLLVPSTYVASAISDPDPDDTVWAHYFVQRTSLADVRLISALTLCAGIGQGFPFVVPEDLSWEFVPYDGGVDILAPTVEFADELEERHAAWLPFDGPGTERIEDGTPVLHEWPEPSWAVRFGRLDRASAERVVQLLDGYEWGFQLSAHAIDPSETFVLELDRADAQLLRAAVTGRPERVLDSLDDPVEADGVIFEEPPRIQVAAPEDARRVLARRLLGDYFYLNEFIDDYGYRDPEEAVDGKLDPKYWNPRHDYSGLNSD